MAGCFVPGTLVTMSEPLAEASPFVESQQFSWGTATLLAMGCAVIVGTATEARR